MLGGNVLFSAKTAADQFVFHYNAVRIPAQHDGNLLTRIVYALV